MEWNSTVQYSRIPCDPRFMCVFAQVICPGWCLCLMTPVAIRNLCARDCPMHMQNALVVWAPRMRTTKVVVVRSGAHTTVAQSRTWTTCKGMQPHRLGRYRWCTYTLGRGRVHFVGAGSVVASETLMRKRASFQRNMIKERMENDAIYKDDHDGLRGPLPPVTHGILSPERRCRQQMILGWPSGHGAVCCRHFVNGDLLRLCCVSAMLGLRVVGSSGSGYALKG